MSFNQDNFVVKNNLNFKVSIGSAFMIAFVLLFFTSFIVGLFGLLLSSFLEQDWVIFLGYSIPMVLFILCFYYFILKPKDKKFNWSFKFNDVFLFPIMILGFFGIVFFSEFLTGLIPTEGGLLGEWYKMMEEMISDLFLYPISSYITVAIMAPILEELIFRGIILKGMLQDKVDPKIAIAVSAFIFGFVHLNPWQFIAAFLFGILFGYIYFRTGSLIWSIIIHFINNSLGFYLALEYQDTDLKDISGLSSSTTFLIGIVLIIITYFLFKKYSKTINYHWNNDDI